LIEAGMPNSFIPRGSEVAAGANGQESPTHSDFVLVEAT
jgi:hypothetical protein